jgi:hypothetical protein
MTKPQAMKLKTKCKECNNEVTVYEQDIKEDRYKDKGDMLKLHTYGYKIRAWYRCDLRREETQHHKLLAYVTGRYFVCLCGEKNYLNPLTAEQIIKRFPTEYVKDISEDWHIDPDDE